MWESESESFSGRDYGNDGALTSNRQGVKTDGFELRDQSWEEISLAVIGVDLFVQVGGINFYLHKYLLLSRSGKFNPMIYEARDLELCKVVLDDLPDGGGPRGRQPDIQDMCRENTGKTPKVSSPKWNGDVKDSSPSRNMQVPPDWCFEDVSILRIDHFVRVITAIKVKGMRYELIGAAIAQYVSKWLPGLLQDRMGPGDDKISSLAGSSSWKGELHMVVAGHKDETPMVQSKDQRMII
ncbi:hypothetical protein MLD38_035476 [Melastoma candidum]|uniref:Uncharacterized protein n=1 Tax=Melastoma candidum TaxID=119954 RepID=A0ACB9LG99_9MYRT|nr:hypothetical protein MLD38_035476 [Melastoma candidum]